MSADLGQRTDKLLRRKVKFEARASTPHYRKYIAPGINKSGTISLEMRIGFGSRMDGGHLEFLYSRMKRTSCAKSGIEGLAIPLAARCCARPTHHSAARI